MAGRDQNVTVRDARIIFKNFSGAEGMYNRAGDRNFAVVLDEDIAERLLKDNWNVKRLKPRDDDEQGSPYLGVAVSYKGRPPTAVLISSAGRTVLDEDSISILDRVDIEHVDLVFAPYDWKMPNGSTGRKAYLQSIYVTMYEDELAREYNVLEVSTVNGPAMSETDDPMGIHTKRGEMQELER